MAWPNGVDPSPILLGAYALADALDDLTERLLPFDGPTDDRIDYGLAYELYVVASATLSDRVVELLDLIDASMPD